MKLKPVLFFFIASLFVIESFAQTDTGIRQTDTGTTSRPRSQDTITSPRADTARRAATRPKPVNPTVLRTDPVVDTTVVAMDTSRTGTGSLGTDTSKEEAPLIIIDTTNYNQYFRHPHLGFDKAEEYMLMKERIPNSKDRVFYLLVGLLIFVAVIRLLFPKYFHSTFRLFFQSSFRQKQTREQLLQQSLGSILLNLLFFFSSAVYITMVLEHYEWAVFPFWQLLLYSCLGLAVLYIGKFLFLTFAGWIFNVKEGAETYIFIVFLINKIIGVMLIPFVLVIAFADHNLAEAAITASLILLALLFFYRYIVSLNSFRRDLHINPFHFFLYLCGVEIVPLLVLGKALSNYIDGRF